MAKPLTRLARALANKMGYDLLRLQKTHIHHEARSGLGRGDGFDAFEATLPRPIKAFDIYFRCCSQVEIHGQDRKRIVDVPKEELVLRCLNRLVQSVNHASSQNKSVKFTLNVADDHSDADCIDGIEAILERAECPTRLINLTDSGNGPSVGAVLRHARQHALDVVYFVEDDYLHSPFAIHELVSSYGRLVSSSGTGDVVLFPADYPERYRHVEQSLILLGSHRHWRTINATTFTIVTSLDLLKRFWDSYIGLEKYGVDPEVTEDSTINRIYDEVLCFSPMESLAVHLQHFETLSPFVDWREWWDQSALTDAEPD